MKAKHVKKIALEFKTVIDNEQDLQNIIQTEANGKVLLYSEGHPFWVPFFKGITGGHTGENTFKTHVP